MLRPCEIAVDAVSGECVVGSSPVYVKQPESFDAVYYEVLIPAGQDK